MPSVSRAGFITPHAPRVAFYERVSTDEQSKRDTISSQDKKLHKAYDWHFREDSNEPWLFVGTFRDDGISGTIPLEARPDGARLMSLIRRGEIDIVCVAASDRLARDRGVAEAIAEEFSGREILIKSPSEFIDLTTPAGRLQFAIMSAFGHFEREQIRIRTMNGRVNHAESGDWINGPVPFGYVLERHASGGYRLAPSERTIAELGCTERELVVQIFERVGGGESLLSVMRWLQATGMPSVKRYFNKKSGQYTENVYPKWQYSKLLDIVNNTTYYGKRVLKFHTIESNKYKKTAAPVTQMVPPLISKDLFDRAEKARQRHAANWESPREDEYVYLLGGKLVCGGCKSHMRGNYQKASAARKNAKFYYVCTRRKGSTEHLRLGLPCSYVKSVQGNFVEEFVLAEFDRIAAAPDAMLAKLREQQFEANGNIGSQEPRMQTLRKRLGALERERNELLDLVGTFTLEQIRAKEAAKAEQAAEVRRELELLEGEDNMNEALAMQMHNAEASVRIVAEDWPAVRARGIRSEMRAFIQPLIQRVEMHPDHMEVAMLSIVSQRTHDKAHLFDYLRIVSPLTWERSFSLTG